MDIQYAILGYLSWQSFSGYDLKKLIAESELFYWSGNNNQIYNTLIHLHRAGLVEQQVEYQENLPPRKIYTITEMGREELRKQMHASPELPELHHHFLIQLAWTDELPAAELDELLARYEEEVAVRLRMSQVQASAPAGEPGRTRREKFLWRRIAANRTDFYRRELDWVRALRHDLQNENFSL
jgi:PadR family transcriptional regulator, regulatory protein AphA